MFLSTVIGYIILITVFKNENGVVLKEFVHKCIVKRQLLYGGYSGDIKYAIYNGVYMSNHAVGEHLEGKAGKGRGVLHILPSLTVYINRVIPKANAIVLTLNFGRHRDRLHHLCGGAEIIFYELCKALNRDVQRSVARAHKIADLIAAVKAEAQEQLKLIRKITQ